MNYIADFAERSGIDKVTLEKAVVSKVVDGKIFIDLQTDENFRKLLYLKNNGRYIIGDTPMELRGEWLEKWIQMAKSQPILID